MILLMTTDGAAYVSYST